MITLLLLKKDKSVNIQFIEFLMRRIYKLFISSIDDKKLISWNVYINDNKLFRSIYRKSISAKEIPELNRISIGNQIIKNNKIIGVSKI